MKHPATRYITKLDSTTSLLRALGRYLQGRDFPALGVAPAIPGGVAMLVNALPAEMRASLYRWTGWMGGTTMAALSQVDAEEISDWVVGHYPPAPQGGWPGVMLGSANGAAIHLAAAMGIPWLPQTFLTPVRRHLHADDLLQDLEWGKRAADAILSGNSDLCAHQMHDPVHDRHMVQRIGYFRLKRLRLGQVYEEFLRTRLQPGATIWLVECQLRWPVTRVSERHLFQVGGFGDMQPGEYLQGSLRVREFLNKYDSNRVIWQVPEPTDEAPEGEWGFREELIDDVRRIAQRHNYRLQRIAFTGPDDLSPLTADLYRWWYERRGIRPDKLLAECFALIEPYWTLRTGSVPYWLAFTANCCAQGLEQYLAGRSFDQINLMLFSNGIEGIGIAPIQRWRSILQKARQQGQFIGVDEAEFPRDYASFVRYHSELPGHIAARHPMPGPLSRPEFDDFLLQAGNPYAVKILDGTSPAGRPHSTSF